MPRYTRLAAVEDAPGGSGVQPSGAGLPAHARPSPHACPGPLPPKQVCASMEAKDPYGAAQCANGTLWVDSTDFNVRRCRLGQEAELAGLAGGRTGLARRHAVARLACPLCSR